MKQINEYIVKQSTTNFKPLIDMLDKCISYIKEESDYIREDLNMTSEDADQLDAAIKMIEEVQKKMGK